MLSVSFKRLFGLSTHGVKNFYDIKYEAGDAFMFGPETRGLPQHVREALGKEFVLRLPMRPENRSLNLSNTAAIVVYEAWRQCGFAGSI